MTFSPCCHYKKVPVCDLKTLVLSRFLAYLLFRIFVIVLVLIYRWAIIHVYVSIIAILLYFDDMIDIK